jgi:hypothetical protein
MNDIEFEIVYKVAERLIFGQDQYGYWQADNSGRDMKRELFEEILDGMVYSARKLNEDKNGCE